MARRPRNERVWFENGDLLVLDKNCGVNLRMDVLVEILGLAQDTPEGEVIYFVAEAVSKQTYHASDKNLRKPKGREEVDRLLKR